MLGVRARGRVPDLHLDVRAGRRARQRQGVSTRRCAAKRPDLAHVRYGVFGLGDRTYAETFNFGGKRFDDCSPSSARQRIGERVQHDASSGMHARGDCARMGRAVACAGARGRPGRRREDRRSACVFPRQTIRFRPPRIEMPRAVQRRGRPDRAQPRGRARRQARVHRRRGRAAPTPSSPSASNRFGSGLLALGLQMEDRVLIAMHDTHRLAGRVSSARSRRASCRSRSTRC